MIFPCCLQRLSFFFKDNQKYDLGELVTWQLLLEITVTSSSLTSFPLKEISFYSIMELKPVN